MDERLYNIAFERSILSSIVFEPQIFEDMTLNVDDFYLPMHGFIYAAMGELTTQNKPIDEEFLKNILLPRKQFDEQVMLGILSANPISNITAYIDEIKEKSKLRKILSLSVEMRKMISEDNASSNDVLSMIELQLQSYEQSNGTSLPITMQQAIADYDDMTEPPKIKTGIRKLDEMLCDGIEPAQLVHLGGEKNIGKTTLLKQVLYNTSAGFDNLFFSFEMPRWKMAKYTKKMTGLSDLSRYHIIDTEMMKSTDVSDVVRMIRLMHRKHGIRFVLIDSKMKLTHKSFSGFSESDRKGDIDAVLNRVVQETGVVIMMIVQLSNESIKSGSMSSYGSGLSDYEADMQVMMYHSKSTSGAVEVKISKNRQEVMYKPIKLWLNKDELKFDDVRTVDTTYTDIKQSNSGGSMFSDGIEISVI